MSELIAVGQSYGWNIIIAALMGFQVIFQGMSIGSIRKKLFTASFFKTNFPEFEQDNYPQGGYPDMGNGRFSDKLSLKDWTTFNNYQRAHYNYVEGIASVITLELLSGLFFPRFAVLFGLIYIVGREIYARGYRGSGAKGRMYGALFLDVALVALFGATLYGAYNFGGGYQGFLRLFKF